MEWTRHIHRNARSSERGRDGSLRRQDRLAGAGREPFRKGRVLRLGRRGPQGGERLGGPWRAAALGLSGPVEPEAFQRVLEGEVPGGRRLGRKEMDSSIHHRCGRDATLSAPKSVSLMAMVCGDERIVDADDKAVGKTPAWIQGNVVETRLRDPGTGAMVRAGDQKMVAATFRHDTSRNLDP